VPRRGHDPGRLGTHAEDAAAARRQDLEVQIVELGPELVPGGLEGLLDGLAAEFLVRTHVQRRLPRRP
jgi:hypothetical protein